MTITFRTTSAESTRSVAATIGRELQPGDVVLLVGSVGAGKTTFAQGLAHGLGVEGPVTSPSFTLVQHYSGRIPVAHIDVYRLERIQELHDLGLEELIDGPGVTFVEWGDAVQQVLPRDHLVVKIELGDGDDRTIGVEAVGSEWRERQAGLERALGSFAGTQHEART